MLIAVYGTLMSGHGRAGALEDLATLVGPCRLRGDLYAVGTAFPALRPGEGEVKGEIWEVADENVERLLQRTDAIEGYTEGREDHSMYVRRHVQLVEPAGAEAWTYVWNRSMDHLTFIPSGDWRAFEERARREWVAA